MKRVVVLYGPPGSGKGMQANLLQYHRGFFHFDSGKYIEHVVHDPANRRDPVIRKQRRFFDTGYLCTPSWILKITKTQAEKFSKAGLSVVFSGSLRTLHESKGLIPTLEKLYGRRNLKFFSLEVPEDAAVRRNLSRLRCSLCGAIIIDTGVKLRRCPICKGRLVHRTMDNRKDLVKRFKEYRARTEPVFEYLKKRGYKVIKVDGRPLPETVFRNILERL